MDEQMGIKRVPYYRKPKELTVEEWQAALRKQYSLEQKFKVTNSGSEPLYSDYEVYNPETNKTYKVSIRDNISSFNYCSCPDFRVNTLLLSLEENVNVDSVKALVYGTLLIYNGSIAFAVTGLYMASIGYAILATNALPK